DLVHQPYAVGFLGIEAFAGERVTPYLAQADGVVELRHDDGAGDSDAHFGDREVGIFGSDHDVAGGNDAGAATVAGALHQRDRRHRQQIEPLHHFSGHARGAQIVFGRGAAHGVKPIDVGAGDEIAAVAGYHHRAQRFTSERIIDLEQRRYHLAVIDVVDLRPVERDARDTALVQAPEHRTGCRRFIHLPYPLTMRTMPQRCTVARSSEPNTRRSNTKPMAPITTRAASMTSVLRNSLASKITQPNPQSE